MTDRLIKAIEQGEDTKTPEPETEKAESLFAAMRSAAWENIRAFLEPELWKHFGTEERVVEALRLLVELASREARRVG